MNAHVLIFIHVYLILWEKFWENSMTNTFSTGMHHFFVDAVHSLIIVHIFNFDFTFCLPSFSSLLAVLIVFHLPFPFCSDDDDDDDVLENNLSPHDMIMLLATHTWKMIIASGKIDICSSDIISYVTYKIFRCSSVAFVALCLYFIFHCFIKAGTYAVDTITWCKAYISKAVSY